MTSDFNGIGQFTLPTKNMPNTIMKPCIFCRNTLYRLFYSFSRFQEIEGGGNVSSTLVFNRRLFTHYFERVKPYFITCFAFSRNFRFLVVGANFFSFITKRWKLKPGFWVTFFLSLLLLEMHALRLVNYYPLFRGKENRKRRDDSFALDWYDATSGQTQIQGYLGHGCMCMHVIVRDDVGGDQAGPGALGKGKSIGSACNQSMHG